MNNLYVPDVFSPKDGPGLVTDLPIGAENCWMESMAGRDNFDGI